MNYVQKQPSMKPPLRRFPRPKPKLTKHNKGILITDVVLSVAVVEKQEKF